MTEFLDETDHRIAIVGMAARLPGADDIYDFWRNLCEGRESISRFSREQLLAAGVPAGIADDPQYVAAAGILSDVAGFDATLFQMTGAEAAVTDPQHRLFLEAAWHALEDGGLLSPDTRHRTGVYASTDFNTYLPAVIAPRLGSVGPARAFQVEMGNDKDFMASRVSYKLDLTGPSMMVQTACSSSLVAVHMACEALLSGACDTAVAGGARIHVPQEDGHLYHEGGVASSEAHCRAFDSAASGTLRGNGAAAVVLKRAGDAIRDGDHIYAMVLGSAVNNDGAGKIGYTAPSIPGQTAAIREALAVAEVEPGEVTYVETHGTGTSLGDPIEFQALSDALDGMNRSLRPCVLSAVKSNIGHLGSTAGVTGLIKAVLALHHQVVPGTVHFRSAGPDVPLESSRFVITSSPTPWPSVPGRPRVGGVSSFGIGGTNCHVVLGEAPLTDRGVITGNGAELLTVSAATPTALAASARRLTVRLAADDAPELVDVAHTLQVGRRDLPFRWAAAVDSPAQAVELLTTMKPSSSAPLPPDSVTFLFPGQGSEYAGLALRSCDRFPAFAADLRHSADVLAAECGVDLFAWLRTGRQPDGTSLTAVVQPGLFAVEHALAQLWMSWGVEPTSLIGHSVGEYAAASVAGVFSKEDGLRLTAARGRSMAAMTTGAMAAVPAPEDRVRRLLGDSLSIAAVNAPDVTVVSGPEAALVLLEERLTAEHLAMLRLRVDRAFHSPAVRAVEDELRGIFGTVQLQAPRIPVMSNLTGRILTAEEAVSPEYWLAQAAEPVRFLDCVRSASGPNPYFLELGPGDALTRFTRQGLSGSVNASSVLGRTPDQEHGRTLAALQTWWTAGGDVDWTAACAAPGGRRIKLPTYPMERRRYWFGDNATVSAKTPAEAVVVPEPAEIEGDSGTAESSVLSIVAEVMGVDVSAVDHELPLVEQGLDSLGLLETAERIRTEFDVRLPLVDMLGESGSVIGLAMRLQGVRRRAVLPSPQPSAGEPGLGGVESPQPIAEPAPRVEPGVTDPQRHYIADLVDRFVAQTSASKAYNERHRSAHADPRNSAGFRDLWKEMVYPIVTERAAGAHVWDLDGNRYTDLTMGFGVALLGHSPAVVTTALGEQLQQGFTVGPQSALVGKVSDQVCQLTGHKRVVFTNSGTDAVMTAVRVARAATRRDKVVIFRGSYHGSYDGLLARAQRTDSRAGAPLALGVPSSLVRDVIVLEYGTPESLEFIAREGRSLAAVIAEPVQSRRPSFQPIKYLRDMRAVTRAHGTLLVLDEVITGFRAHPGGVNMLWDLEADVVTYGKVLGGGLPIGAVAGRADVLDLIDGGQWRYGDGSRPETDLTFFAGTFCKHPLAMAAASAVLTEIQRQGPRLQEDLSERTANFARRLGEVVERWGASITVDHFASQLLFETSTAGGMGDLVLKELIHRQVYVWEGRTAFLSTAHSEDDVDRVVEAFSETVGALVGSGVLPTSRSKTVLPAPGLPPATRDDPSKLPLRDEQLLLWLGTEMTADSAGAYNEIITIPVRGRLEADLVARTVNLLITRHDALRLRMDPLTRQQTILADDTVKLEIIDVGPDDEGWSQARREVRRLRDREFAVADDRVVAASLLRFRPDDWAVVLVFPHAAVDGWSVGLLRNDFKLVYDALAGDRTPEPPPGSSFRDFVLEEDRTQRADIDRVEAYWSDQLEGLSPASVLGEQWRSERSYTAQVHEKEVAVATANDLRSVAAARSTTPYVVGLAAWFVTLAAATGRSDLPIAAGLTGQVVTGRPGLVGYALKILPIRVDLATVDTFGEVVDLVAETLTGAMEFWHVSQLKLIEKYWPGESEAKPPMGGVNFDMELREAPLVLHGCDPIDADLAPWQYTKWDAAVVLVDAPTQMLVELVHNPAVVHDATATALLDHYVQVLEQGCRTPDQPWRIPSPLATTRPVNRRRRMTAD